MKKGWEIMKLGEVCEYDKKPFKGSNLPYLGLEDIQSNTGQIVKPLEIRSVKSLTFCFTNVHVLYGRLRPYLNKVLLPDFDGHCSTEIFPIRPKKNLLNRDFLFHWLKWTETMDKINATWTGATLPRANMNMVLEFNFPLPPLPEQHHIVAILDEAFDAIATAKTNAEQNLKNARELFESVLDSILYDKKWKIKELGEVCTKVEYGSSTKSKPKGRIPVLRMGNIQNRVFTWDSLVYSDDEEDNKQYLLKYNDVLFNRTNSPELVGKTAIYKGELPAIFAGYLIRIHRKENLLDADYLNYYLNSKMAKEYGRTVVISSVNQANINGTKLKTYPIPVPTFNEQQTIVAKLDALSAETKRLEAIYQQKIADLEELKKSVLQKAFSGELSA